MLKICFKCGRELETSQFYPHPRMADGTLNKCKDCTKRDVVATRKRNVEYYREYDLARSDLPHRVAARAKYDKIYRIEKSGQAHANSLVSSALRQKRLKKLPCQICGNTRAEAHHPDYSRPLEVVWLCRVHHCAVHHGEIDVSSLPERVIGTPSNRMHG